MKRRHGRAASQQGGATLMANNFLKNLDNGTLIDRMQPSTRKNKKKRVAASPDLMKFARPRPTATDNAEGNL